jgi:excisionase family DNA binding protein
MINEKKDYYTTTEIAGLLGISRIAVFKKIKKGQINASKIGRSYAIPKSELESILGKSLTEEQKELLTKAVRKTVKEYGETLKLLGRE